LGLGVDAIPAPAAPLSISDRVFDRPADRGMTGPGY
jgi:hypothetical protein